MKKYFPLLLKSSLFTGIDSEEIEKLTSCLNMRVRVVERDSYVFYSGDNVRCVYLILSGGMHIIDEDYWGNRSIIETMPEHTLFGEAYSLSNSKSHLVSVVAASKSVILEIDPVKLFETCAKHCPCHGCIIHNTMRILSEKIVRLTTKLRHVLQRTTREKVLSYLSRCSIERQTNSFFISYSRQQLADYLGVERSALSHELSKLRNDGLIRYRKNHFELL